MKKILLLTGIVIIALSAWAQDCSDLIISEYIEGDSQNKGVEIYNPTSSPISLDGYKLVRFSNGDVYPTDELDLASVDSVPSVQPYDVIFVVNGQTVENDYGVVDPELYAMADIAGAGEYGLDPNYFNGNDAVAILYNENLVDLLGKIGEDPGEGWCDADSLDYVAGDYYWLSWTSNHTLIRKPSVKQGVTANPQYFNPAAQWDSLPINTWTHIGYHECECDPNYGAITENQNTTKEVKLAVYPNPIKKDGQFTVMASENIKQIDLFNVIGSLEKTIEVQDRTGLVKANAVDLKSGMYLIRVLFKDNSQKTTQLIIN